MKRFRQISIFLAVLNMVGEVYRSVGDGRHIIWILDDVFVGLYILISALLFTKDTPARRAMFASAWGVGVGMAYGSFFSKLLDPASINAGNLNATFLTVFIGFAFGVSILGVILAVFLPYHKEPSHE